MNQLPKSLASEVSTHLASFYTDEDGSVIVHLTAYLWGASNPLEVDASGDSREEAWGYAVKTLEQLLEPTDLD